MTGGLIGLVVALIVATAVGLLLRRRSGRFRPVSAASTNAASTNAASTNAASTNAASTNAASTNAASAPLPSAPAEATPTLTETLTDSLTDALTDALTEADLGTGLGERATLVQFSTAFCAPCRPTRQILGQVAGMVDGVVHMDIDATSRLDLVRRLRVNSTPTILVLGPDGRIAKRATGLPRKADVIAALGLAIGTPADQDGPIGSASAGNVTGARSDSRGESE
jgi:thiol-disulfide isomerase/thioredoxin